MIEAHEILRKYLSFFEKQGHTVIPNAPLVLQNDPTTLFTSSGMQPLLPYLLGEVHPDGKRLVNVQNCIRTQDIEEIGDNRHTTFFRMIGNWSLGNYFKKDQIKWFFEFLTDTDNGIGLDPKRLYVTVFAGDTKSRVKLADDKEIDLSVDADSRAFWSTVFESKNIHPLYVDMTTDNTSEAIASGRIFAYDVKKNWWSRIGIPENMPSGEPGGPDTEVFYDFGTPHDNAYGEYCHPNCDCGRFMEIGNSVFMQYQKQDDGTFKELPQKNVDFGGGLERLAAAVNNDPDVFMTDIYKPILTKIEQISHKSYAIDKTAIRIIADHLKAAVYLIIDGVIPANKEQGYVLRRLLRRSMVKMRTLTESTQPSDIFREIVATIIHVEETLDPRMSKANLDVVYTVIAEELDKFSVSLEKGLNILDKTNVVNAKTAFDLYQSYGFPFEITQELLAKKGQKLDKAAFDAEFTKHKDSSRTASAGKFKGGLADHSEQTIMGHTATHLLHQALRDVLGSQIHQTGSNITAERIRFDFNYENKLSDEQIKQVEEIVNEKIKANLPVHFELIDTKQAHQMGAIGLFMDTYGEKSKIYFIGDTNSAYTDAYSIEFCGGPHVSFTGELKSFKINKQENLGKNQKRLYGVVGSNE